MRPLTPPQLLRVLEEGSARLPVDRALLLLAEACPDEPWEALATLPIGHRNDRLLTLREWMFGSAITGVAGCPACGERLELSFSVGDLRAGATGTLPAGAAMRAAEGAEGATGRPEGGRGPPQDTTARPPQSSPGMPEEELSVEADRFDVRFRLPNSADIAAVHDAPDGGTARQRLLERCVLGARRGCRARSVSGLPARVVAEVVRRMGEADPLADVHTSLGCPACAHEWRAGFDIVSFLWTEIETWASRTLREVHLLASAYAWREADILALSPRRRRLYLEMVLQ